MHSREQGTRHFFRTITYPRSPKRLAALLLFAWLPEPPNRGFLMADAVAIAIVHEGPRIRAITNRSQPVLGVELLRPGDAELHALGRRR
jgi:hypothetical protein